MTKHHKHGPSGAPSFTKCSMWEGSSTSSQAADEGTLAHEIAEHKLNAWDWEHLKDHDLYKPEMDEYTDAYRDYVLKRKTEVIGAELHVELKLDVSSVIPGSFGTCDIVIVGDGRLIVIDFKYGFTPVYAKSEQLIIYGRAALERFNLLYNIDVVVLEIFQPRIDNYSGEVYPVDDLVAISVEIEDLAAKAIDPNHIEYTPGEVQCKYCAHAGDCAARAAYQLSLAKEEFGVGSDRLPTLSIGELGYIYSRAADFKNWIEAIETKCLDQAYEHGVGFEGYKLVRSTTKNRWCDDAPGRLRDREDLWEKKLISVTKAKKILKEEVNDYLTKPVGKPQLVPNSDRRKPIEPKTQPSEDFK